MKCHLREEDEDSSYLQTNVYIYQLSPKEVQERGMHVQKDARTKWLTTQKMTSVNSQLEIDFKLTSSQVLMKDVTSKCFIQSAITKFYAKQYL